MFEGRKTCKTGMYAHLACLSCKQDRLSLGCILKQGRQSFNLKWKINARAKPYYIGSKSCNLCLTEKFFILKADKNRIVNHRDLKIKCRHRFKFKLKNI